MNHLFQKLYKLSLSFYPKSFRDEYRGQMLQTLEDMKYEGRASWPDLLVDLFVSIPREYLYKTYNIGNMNKKFMILTAVVGLVSATAYILVDDNNVVSSGVENAFYTVAWIGIISTAFLAIRRRRLSSEK